MKTLNPFIHFIFLLLAIKVAYSQPRVQIDVVTPSLTIGCIQVANASPLCDCHGGQIPVSLGTTEVLLSNRATITITNPSGANLNITGIELSEIGANTNMVHWTVSPLIPPTAGWVISPGNQNTIDIEFSPLNIPTLTLGQDLPVMLRIKTNAPNDLDGDGTDDECFEDADPATPELEIDFRLLGSAKKTTINYSLVLDRSGSMSTVEGSTPGKRRIDMLAEAASFFYDLSRLRSPFDATGDGDFDDPEDFKGDMIGMVKYDDVIDSYFPSGYSNALNPATTEYIEAAKLLLTSSPPDGSTYDPDQIAPRNSTAIGDAVIHSVSTQLTSVAAPPQKNVLILFSDGYENAGTRVNQTGVTDLLASRQDVNIYSIGLGEADDAIMQQYSSLSGLSSAYYYKVATSSGSGALSVGGGAFGPYDLSSFYFKIIYHHALGQAIVTDPTFDVNLNDLRSRELTNVSISSSDKKATFVVFDNPELRKYYKLEVLTPKGQPLSASPLSDGLTVKTIGDYNYKIYEVDFAGSTDSSSYIGKWKLKIFPDSLALRARKDSISANTKIGFTVSALSNLQLESEIGTVGFLPGNELVFTLSAADQGLQVNSLNKNSFNVVLTLPNGRRIALKPTLSDFGKLVYRYSDTFESGVYKIYAKGTIANSKKEISSREELRFIVLGNSYERHPPLHFCIKCIWIKVLVIVVIILLLVIIWRTVIIQRMRQESKPK